MTPEREYEINVAWNRDNMSGTEAITVVGELLDALHSANERADAAERILDETLHQAAAQLRSHQADTAKATARIAALEGALEVADNLTSAVQRWLGWRKRGHGDGIEAQDTEKALAAFIEARAALRPPQ